MILARPGNKSHIEQHRRIANTWELTLGLTCSATVHPVALGPNLQIAARWVHHHLMMVWVQQ